MPGAQNTEVILAHDACLPIAGGASQIQIAIPARQLPSGTSKLTALPPRQSPALNPRTVNISGPSASEGRFERLLLTP